MSKDVIETESRALRALSWAVDSAMGGLPGFSSAEDLAREYLGDGNDVDQAVNSIIRWHVAKNGSIGVASGMAGVLNVPAAVASIAGSFGASWLIQARLAGAIAVMYGHDLKSDRVRTAIMWVVLGDTANASISATGKALAESAIKAGISKIPGSTVKAINKALGRRAITVAGKTGLINLGRLVPVLGGVVGGAIDGGGCFVIGKSAKMAFRPS